MFCLLTFLNSFSYLLPMPKHTFVISLIYLWPCLYNCSSSSCPPPLPAHHLPFWSISIYSPPLLLCCCVSVPLPYWYLPSTTPLPCYITLNINSFLIQFLPICSLPSHILKKLSTISSLRIHNLYSTLYTYCISWVTLDILSPFISLPVTFAHNCILRSNHECYNLSLQHALAFNTWH